ncbi:DUF1289 domain-containing protein [Sphingomonas sp. Leaf25]|uniref:DUF1289 domain-containing protein n=1 Tax=Sphingomonas sp. Leaf25 TaxID=1735692 RepID=UPI0006FADE68|nr:DUF1289 domain-containing protein [Sphingomonas sp. Leaf25]KQN07282.1 hypothetical protein ASE78_13820 [Sphingomonas sp. Leaf25]
MDANDPFEAVAPVAIESPCTLVCSIDSATGWCFGCGRTRDEIACWTSIDPAARRQVMATLPERMAILDG